MAFRFLIGLTTEFKKSKKKQKKKAQTHNSTATGLGGLVIEIFSEIIMTGLF